MSRPFGQLAKQVLRAVQALGEAGQAYAESPLGSMGSFTRWLKRQTELSMVSDETKLRRTIWRLWKKGLIRFEHHKVELSPEAMVHLEEIDLDQLTLKQPSLWDGLWRMVIWDIPEKQREKRDGIRAKLSQLGFVRIQQSIWVTPYPCREELEAIRSAYGLDRGLLYVEAQYVEGERALRAHFHLTTPAYDPTSPSPIDFTDQSIDSKRVGQPTSA